MNAEDKIAVSILRIRHRQPFFGVLALFAEHRLDASIPTAATDGRVVLFNPDFALSLSENALDAVMVHELLHAALLHCSRRGERDPYVWNVAADIVVNGIIRSDTKLSLPEGACLDTRLEHFEVEEVYQILLERQQEIKAAWLGGDLLPPGSKAQRGTEELPEDAGFGDACAAYWKQALQQASTLAEGSGRGKISGALSRWIQNITQPQLDWQSLLWRFLVRTPVDFCGFDRRLIGRGLYLESLEGESISVRIAVDTSGSVSGAVLDLFLSEVRGILKLYPHLEGARLFYADTALYGPYELNEDTMQKPIGCGGTSFEPFFEHQREAGDTGGNTLLIYLTDGFGSFPEFTPEQPVLWVVPPGGLATEAFPFGEVARLSK